MELNKDYRDYAEITFRKVIKEKNKNGEDVMEYMSNLWNTFQENNCRDESCGWYIKTENDLKKFLHESDFVNKVLENTIKKPIKELLNTFILTDDEGNFYFLDKFDFVKQFNADIFTFYTDILYNPCIYNDDELYRIAAYPIFVESKFGAMGETPLAKETWNEIIERKTK